MATDMPKKRRDLHVEYVGIRFRMHMRMYMPVPVPVSAFANMKCVYGILQLVVMESEKTRCQ